MGRWLGIDHGTKRVGIAVGSAPGGIATPLAVVPAEPAESLYRKVAALSDEYGVEGVVVGWPLNMDDSEGPQGALARAAALRLAEALDIDVRLWDERLSSYAADQALAGAFTRKQKKVRQDAVAAAEMLRDFLAADGPERAPRPQDAGPRPGAAKGRL